MPTDIIHLLSPPHTPSHVFTLKMYLTLGYTTFCIGNAIPIQWSGANPAVSCVADTQVSRHEMYILCSILLNSIKESISSFVAMA